MLCALVGVFPVYAAATTTVAIVNVDVPGVFITEFQTNGGSASQEFIELYNATDEPIVFSDPATAGSDQWKIQFFNSTSVKTGAPAWNTATSASNSVALTGTIAPHDYYLLSSTDYLPGGVAADQTYAPSSSHLMTDTGGGLQLLSISGSSAAATAHDRLTWLDPSANPVLPEGVMASPEKGRSLQRLPYEDDTYAGPDGTLGEFSDSADITPLEPWQAPAPVTEPETEPVNTADNDDDVPVTSDDTESPEEPSTSANTPPLAAPIITELLPNPAAPLTDANDEFIELYNPNGAAFDLRGYSLEVGTTTPHSYTFGDNAVLPPFGYQAFYSAETKLPLTNTSGQARLKDPNGAVVGEATAYSGASNNQAWIFADGTWQWSTMPTPAAPNILSVTASGTTVATKSTAKTATKAVAVKKVSAKTTSKTTAKAKTAAAKKTKAKAKTKAKSKSTKTTSVSTVANVKPKPPIHTGVLVAVASIAVLYGLYEYRHDISNKFAQLRRHRTIGSPHRKQIAWS